MTTPLRALISAVINAAKARLTPIAPVLPPPQWLGQHTNPRRNEERKVLKAMGRRQYKKYKARAQRLA